MKKKFMFLFFLFSYVANAALTREEKRRITEAAVVNVLLPDAADVMQHEELEPVVTYMYTRIRDEYVTLFIQEKFCRFLTRFFTTNRPDSFVSTSQERDMISCVTGSNAAPEDFLAYIRPVRDEFRDHIPRESSFCVGNYGLFFADLYANSYDVNQDCPEFRDMIKYILERRGEYANHRIPLSQNSASNIISLPHILLRQHTGLIEPRLVVVPPPEESPWSDVAWNPVYQIGPRPALQTINFDPPPGTLLPFLISPTRPLEDVRDIVHTDAVDVSQTHRVLQEGVLPGASQISDVPHVRRQPVRQAAIIAQEKIKKIAEYEGKRRT